MDLEASVIEKLKGIIDPHTNISLYDMGLISELKINNNTVHLTFTPSSPFCPVGIQLAVAIKKGIKEIKDVKEVNIKVVGHVQEKQLNEMLKTI